MFLRKTVIFLMSKNMAHIKLLAFKEDESHYSEIVVCNINNIMLIQILKIIQRRKKFLQRSRRCAMTLFYGATQKEEFFLMLRKVGYRIQNSFHRD